MASGFNTRKGPVMKRYPNLNAREVVEISIILLSGILIGYLLRGGFTV